MQAWRSFSLAEITLGRVLWHETKNGAAAVASAVVRKNSRRDIPDGGANADFMFSKWFFMFGCF